MSGKLLDLQIIPIVGLGLGLRGGGVVEDISRLASIETFPHQHGNPGVVVHLGECVQRDCAACFETRARALAPG